MTKKKAKKSKSKELTDDEIIARMETALINNPIDVFLTALTINTIRNSMLTSEKVKVNQNSLILLKMMEDNVTSFVDKNGDWLAALQATVFYLLCGHFILYKHNEEYKKNADKCSKVMIEFQRYINEEEVEEENTSGAVPPDYEKDHGFIDPSIR